MIGLALWLTVLANPPHKLVCDQYRALAIIEVRRIPTADFTWDGKFLTRWEPRDYEEVGNCFERKRTKLESEPKLKSI